MYFYDISIRLIMYCDKVISNCNAIITKHCNHHENKNNYHDEDYEAHNLTDQLIYILNFIHNKSNQ